MYKTLTTALNPDKHLTRMMSLFHRPEMLKELELAVHLGHR
jgi:hypothetical protein